jgi:hypothetical protein
MRLACTVVLPRVIAWEGNWVGLGNPCDETTMEMFYAATRIHICNGEKANF